jgi:hypothetical protein
MSFIKEITSNSLVDLMHPENAGKFEALSKMYALLCDGLDLKTDAKENEIKSEVNPLIKYLMKELRIHPASEEFLQLRSDPEKYFKSKPKEICLFLLTNSLQEFSTKSGYYFISPNDYSSVFDIEVEYFTPNINKSWIFAKRFVEPHHSLIIGDPYLFTESSRHSVSKMLEYIAPKQLKPDYHLTLIGNDQNKKNRKDNLPPIQKIKEYIQEIKKLLEKNSPKPVIEFHIYNERDFHDRFILTNNNYIKPGCSFDLIKNDRFVQKESTWDAHKPFHKVKQNGVYFYKTMLEKLATTREWVKNSHNPISTNPLLK